MKVAFLIICHESPDQLSNLLSSKYFENMSCKVFIHYDLNQPQKDYEKLKKLYQKDNFIFIDDRVKCEWGDYSLVQATLKLLNKSFQDESFAADYFYLLSGSCLPIRSFNDLQKYLQFKKNTEFIETTDISKEKWLVEGEELDRIQFYYPFNYKTQRYLFKKFDAFQKYLSKSNIFNKRVIPSELNIHFGSQWFCLSKEMIESLITFLSNKHIQNFFSWSWIPDEFVIQSFVASNKEKNKISNFSLTYYEFDHNGKPLVFDNFNLDHVTKQPFFFARKFILKNDYSNNLISQKTLEFDQIGKKTYDYKFFLHNDKKNNHKRTNFSIVLNDKWRGALDLIESPMIVLVGFSREFLSKLSELIRNKYNIVFLDFIFDRYSMNADKMIDSQYYIRENDISIRNHDISLYLYNLSRSKTEIAGFCLDQCQNLKIRELIRWSDFNVIIANPTINSLNHLKEIIKNDSLNLTNIEKNDISNAIVNKTAGPLHYFRYINKSDDKTCNIFDLEKNDQGDFPYFKEIFNEYLILKNSFKSK